MTLSLVLREVREDEQSITDNTKEETEMEKTGKKFMTAIVVAIVLLPMAVLAGNLEPSGPPAPTMKTLDQIPPTWNVIIPGPQRFIGNGATYLDRETGLTWIAQLDMGSQNWWSAPFSCNMMRASVGTDPYGVRAGWRLPTLEELSTLYEAYPQSAPPHLPDGHPFNMVKSGPDDCYWTSTASPLDSNYGLALTFSVEWPFRLHLPKSSICTVACVRGGR